jgi:hypothetical protein
VAAIFVLAVALSIFDSSGPLAPLDKPMIKAQDPLPAAALSPQVAAAEAISAPAPYSVVMTEPPLSIPAPAVRPPSPPVTRAKPRQ